jgi:hypothetical protein
MQIVKQDDGTVFIYYFAAENSFPIPQDSKLVAIPGLDPPRQVAGVRFDVDLNGVTFNTTAAREFAAAIIKSCEIAEGL